MKRIGIVSIICVELLFLMWLGMGRGLAGEDCHVTHTVQAGETLTAIAVRYDVTVAKLVERNAIPNPNLIRVGQKLCVPVLLLPTVESSGSQPATGTTGTTRALDPSPAGGALDLVAEFRLTDATPSDQKASRWLLMHTQPLGVRYRLPVAAGSPEQVAGAVFTNALTLQAASAADAPFLWLIPNVLNPVDSASPTYTLALVGDQTPLLSLQFGMTPTATISDLLILSDNTGGGLESGSCQVIGNPVSVLGRSAGAEVQMRVELGAGKDAYVGYDVTSLAYWSSPDDLAACTTTPVALALQSAPAQVGYRLLLSLPRSTGGPTAGEGTDADCREWEGVGGVFALLRILWGCPE